MWHVNFYSNQFNSFDVVTSLRAYPCQQATLTSLYASKFTKLLRNQLSSYPKQRWSSYCGATVWCVCYAMSCVLCSFRRTGACCSLCCSDLWYTKLMWSTLGQNVCGKPCPVLFLPAAAALVVDVAGRCIQLPSLVSTPWAPPLIVQLNIAVSRSLEKALCTPASRFCRGGVSQIYVALGDIVWGCSVYS